MADRRISQADIDQLARKLEQLGGALTETERAILRALFDLASAAIVTLPAEVPSGVRPGSGIAPIMEPDPVQPAAADLPKLTAGFENAFQPGPAASFSLGGAATAAGEAEKAAIKVRLV